MENDFKPDVGELKRVTLEEARQFEGMEKYSDEELQQILDSICELCLIAHDIVMQEELEKDS